MESFLQGAAESDSSWIISDLVLGKSCFFYHLFPVNTSHITNPVKPAKQQQPLNIQQNLLLETGGE